MELKYNHILNYYFPCIVFYCKIYPCCWTLEGNEELVRCLITTNTEAFRCVSDSFTAHMDSWIYLFQRKYAHWKGEKIQPVWAATRYKNTGMEEYHQTCSVAVDLLKLPTAISESERSCQFTPTTFWFTLTVSDFKPLYWCLQGQDPPQSSSNSALAVGPAPASYHLILTQTTHIFQKIHKWKVEQNTGLPRW